MPTSLVTGGAGFIGSHVTDHLIAAGHAVVVLDDLSGAALNLIRSYYAPLIRSGRTRPIPERPPGRI